MVLSQKCGFRENLQMTSKLNSIPDDFVVTGSPPLSAAGRRPREVQQRSWLSWLSIQRRRRKKAEVEGRVAVREGKVTIL